MSDNKYTAMMGDEERWHTTRANVYRNVNKELADGCEKKAADWRAMREAWEAREKLLTVYYGSHNAKFGPCECGACSEYRKARVT